MREAVAKEAAMDVALVRRIGRSSGGDPPNDDKERINDGLSGKTAKAAE